MQHNLYKICTWHVKIFRIVLTYNIIYLLLFVYDYTQCE